MKAAILSFFLSFNCVSILALLARDFEFEFGNDEGEVYFIKDGHIPVFQYMTEVNIPAPPLGSTLTYIKIIVNSLTSPKVDYVKDFEQITIKFTWMELTYSTYSMIVKAKKEYTLKDVNTP